MTEAADTQADAYPRRGDILEEKYEIHEVLGAGAMGCVLKAQHLLRRVPVALKFVSPAILGNREIVERFLNEGVASSKIDSDHVVKVFDVSKLPSGVPYIVMELLEGEDLYRLLRREGKPYLEDVQRAVYFTLQILRGLQAAHRVNIVHRDMKPANCFVTSKDGEPDFIKIVDFGISKIRRDEGDAGLDLTSAQAALGTPLYMSLEQARSPKDVDARSDLYSVAVILYELLGGITPFVPQSGTLSELFTMIALEQPPPLSDLRPELPEALVRAVHKGLHKDRAARYQSAAEMAEALAPFSDERSDHLLSRFLKTAHGPRTRPPPASAAASPPSPGSPPAQTGTLMMSGAPVTTPPPPRATAADSAPGAVVAVSKSGASEPPKQAPPLLEPRRGTPLVWAIAVVAVGAVAAAAWALGKVSAPAPSEKQTIVMTEPPPAAARGAADPTATASTPVLSAPSAEPAGSTSAAAAASASVAPTNATVRPPPTTQAPTSLTGIKRD
jgi:serine/threonine protein kinase